MKNLLKAFVLTLLLAACGDNSPPPSGQQVTTPSPPTKTEAQTIAERALADGFLRAAIDYKNGEGPFMKLVFASDKDVGDFSHLQVGGIPISPEFYDRLPSGSSWNKTRGRLEPGAEISRAWDPLKRRSYYVFAIKDSSSLTGTVQLSGQQKRQVSTKLIKDVAAILQSTADSSHLKTFSYGDRTWIVYDTKTPWSELLTAPGTTVDHVRDVLVDLAVVNGQENSFNFDANETVNNLARQHFRSHTIRLSVTPEQGANLQANQSLWDPHLQKGYYWGGRGSANIRGVVLKVDHPQTKPRAGANYRRVRFASGDTMVVPLELLPQDLLR